MRKPEITVLNTVPADQHRTRKGHRRVFRIVPVENTWLYDLVALKVTESGAVIGIPVAKSPYSDVLKRWVWTSYPGAVVLYRSKYPRPKQSTVTQDGWGFGNTSGSNIKGAIISAFKIREVPRGAGPIQKPFKVPIQKGQLDGHKVEIEDYDARAAEVRRLGLVYGYTQLYSRNTGQFVMSRAARKRGVKVRGHPLDQRSYRNQTERYAGSVPRPTYSICPAMSS